ncbi:NADPH-dependent FMN reductase [Periweissella fabalis]|uniref:NAD(P)H-dependent oxidoreductase n=1 Tax=Periweissella fabalis TaxID=1070421 RepID=A0A7X6N520_9LACO|nr:NADPH-dependent FMN reductase [Periweissella fabalis]MCM0599892.1 NAD(P)H-dependent oxidoreductase [Periweissella fabalis]NKZ24053.1 NAD(P)H-dependent oxidoreductase [Periweissella fabalis]
MNFVAIVGTNARKSYNRKLLWFMKKHFKDQVNIEIIEIADLPLFNEDDEAPLRIGEIARSIQASDGVIISTPEYDHSITAALKSFIEWMSYGTLHPFTNKPVMLVGASLGRQGTNNAQEHLRQIMDAPGLDALVLPGNQFLVGPAAQIIDMTTEELTDANTIGFLETIMQHFIRFASLLQPMCGEGVDRTKPAPTSDVDIATVNLGYASLDSVMPGSPLDEDAIPTIIQPTPTAAIIEKGDGWWVEKTMLTDKVAAPVVGTITPATATPVEADATTGASMF